MGETTAAIHLLLLWEFLKISGKNSPRTNVADGLDYHVLINVHELDRNLPTLSVSFFVLSFS